MARQNVIPIRFSDRELEMIGDTGKRVGCENTSEAVRYSTAHTSLALANDLNDPLLKPGETVVILPDELVAKIEGLDMQGDIDFADRVWALLFKWEL